MKKLGFIPNINDSLVLNKAINEVQLIVLIYVDDLMFSWSI